MVTVAVHDDEHLRLEVVGVVRDVDLNATKDGNLACADKLRVNDYLDVVPDVLVEELGNFSCR